MKRFKALIAVCGLLFAVCFLVGCGERVENTSYYYSPSLTRDGQIIYIYGLQSVKKDVIGTQISSTYTESVGTTSQAGSGFAFLFEVTGAPAYYMSCSPVNDYVAYLDGLSNGVFSRIVVRNISATSPHTGLEQAQLIFSPGVVSFDWSNTATQFVYCTSNEVHTINIDGTNDTRILTQENLQFVTWKFGAKIIFVYTSGTDTLMGSMNADGTGRLNFAAGATVAKPQITRTNTNLIYGISGGSFCSVDISVGAPATTEVLANYKGSVPRLAYDADVVVYSKTGEQSGIYLLNIAAKTETKIK
ncbi:MAG: hypothetical protein WCV91_00410 [Candidatus Margulisiibacteriota bacterium]